MEILKQAIPLKSFNQIYKINQKSTFKFWFWGIIISFVAFLFLPWTQNIKTNGKITTRMQEDRPQEIQSPIAGKILKWWVKEGDYIKKGDTIMQIAEIKDAYLDPNLIDKTKQQLDAKRNSISFYQNKAQTNLLQIEAINKSRDLKVAQLKNKRIQLQNKLQAEQAELIAIRNDANLTKDQLNRQQKMFDEGLVSQTQLQQRNITYQNALAKLNGIENKIAQTKQEILNNEIEQNTAIQENYEKLQKVQGDRIQSLNEANSAVGDVAKLENQVANYIIRNNMYFIIAPQDGQMVQAKKSGIGEIIKEGEYITMIVPKQQQYAVELFVRPVDFPLVSIGQKVRFLFDGFPAIVFSGWPKGSYGTFGGKIVAFENTVNENGMFRVLVVEDDEDRPWPQQLKVGSGAKGILLLKNVSIWYELWRNINGFPPDFYITNKSKNKEDEKNK